MAFLLCFSALDQAKAQERQSVLLTTFAPFEGRSVNQSDVIGNAAAQLIKTSADAGIDVKVCQLPVDFTKAAKVA